MVVNKRSKSSRHRGSHTHGWGSMKKHRGSGNHGGAGRAGSGKRADSNKPSYWHQRYFGKFGFVSKGHHKMVRAMNISFLEEHIDVLVERKLAKKEGSSYAVNLKDLGCNKLLGKGRLTKALVVTASAATEKAIQAVEGAKGRVVLSAAGDAKDGA
jgi:large subunit ribosomal protein L15